MAHSKGDSPLQKSSFPPMGLHFLQLGGLLRCNSNKRSLSSRRNISVEIRKTGESESEDKFFETMGLKGCIYVEGREKSLEIRKKRFEF